MARKPQAAQTEDVLADEDAGEGVGFEDQNGGLVQDGDDIIVDLSGVTEQSGFEPMPAGIYSAEVDEVEFGMSSKNNPMWTWKFRILDEPFDKRKVFYHTTFTPDDLPRTKSVLRALGFEDLANSSFNPRTIAEDGELVGAVCRIKLRVKIYQGEKRNEVQRVMAAEQGGSALI